MGCRLGLNSILNMLISVIIILIRNSWRSRRESLPWLNISPSLCVSLLASHFLWNLAEDRFRSDLFHCALQQCIHEKRDSWRWRTSVSDVYVLKAYCHLSSYSLDRTLSWSPLYSKCVVVMTFCMHAYLHSANCQEPC